MWPQHEIKRRFTVMNGRLLLLLIVCLSSLVFAQRPDQMPQVTRWDVPYYPPLARAAKVEGVVRIKVTTDGQAVQKVETLEGHALLAEATIKNVKSWRFATAAPTTFTATYTFKLANTNDRNLEHLRMMYPDAEIRAELPLVVEITAAPPPPLD